SERQHAVQALSRSHRPVEADIDPRVLSRAPQWPLTKHLCRCRFVRFIKVSDTDTHIPSCALNLPFQRHLIITHNEYVRCSHLLAYSTNASHADTPSLHSFLRSVSPLISLISNGLCSQVLRPTPNALNF
ncbi:unnamed protein product, partial [Ectocarpus sp. 13 AM-2016]